MDIRELEPEKLCENVFNSIPDAIAIIDNNHRIVRVNTAMAKSIGVEPEELSGRFCYEVVHDTEKPIENCPLSMLVQDHSEHSASVHEENMGGFFQVTTTPLLDDEGKVMGALHIARDMTERIIIENQLDHAIEEKDMLLKEVHHRVKNNLMIISSLLSLQARKIEDEVTRDIFKDSQSRAKCMALIHEKLYHSKDLKKIDIADYIQSLIKNIRQIYANNKNIEIETNLEKIMLDINTAIPVGLILNELLTNAFKYAYPENKEGKIMVNFKRTDFETYILEVADEGIGLPTDFDPESAQSLGMQLIYNLAGQLHGEVEIDADPGTDVKIKLNELKYNTF